MHQRRHPSSRPFLAAPRTAFYHPARQIDAALTGLERGVRRAEGVGLVVGPPGTGKSLLLLALADNLADDFAVALSCGARICTRRALWQAILSGIGEPFRGIDEGELRLAVVERVRGLAATGAGLVILVDEAHTLPLRLLEELRLLTTIPTPLPAVHLVLAGTVALEERLANPRLESLAQRIGGRFTLEALDHAETCAYVRTQMKAATRQWETVFAAGCDDVVFQVTDGVPRLINQVCDLALVRVADEGRARVLPADIESAWADIQRLPVPHGRRPAAPSVVERPDDEGEIEFGVLDGAVSAPLVEPPVMVPGPPVAALPGADPWAGPDVEFVTEMQSDPFASCFAGDDAEVERIVRDGPQGFTGHGSVASDEGRRLATTLARLDHQVAGSPPVATVTADDDGDEADDGDDGLMVIEEDVVPQPSPVRAGRYRDLFARLRRGGG